jgi:hypothetical protein
MIKLKDIKKKTKLLVKKSCHLLGILDETESLPEYCIFGKQQTHFNRLVQYKDPIQKKIVNVNVIIQ